MPVSHLPEVQEDGEMANPRFLLVPMSLSGQLSPQYQGPPRAEIQPGAQMLSVKKKSD